MENAPNLKTFKDKAEKINVGKDNPTKGKAGKHKNLKLQAIIKTLPWTPRIIGILAILLISLSLGDSFDQNLTFWQKTGEFIMHLIHPLIFTTVLIISWKRELIGGILFIIIGLIFSNFTFIQVFNSPHPHIPHINNILLINSPFIIIGILFILSHFKEKRKAK